MLKLNQHLLQNIIFTISHKSVTIIHKTLTRNAIVQAHCVIFFHNYAVLIRRSLASSDDGWRRTYACAVLTRLLFAQPGDGWRRIYPQKISLWHIALAHLPEADFSRLCTACS